MADNSYRSFRNRDTSSRGDAGRDVADDPLAELARLIGQSDPAGERGRDDWRAETYGDAPAAEMEWAADESYADQRYQAADTYPPQRAAEAFPPLPPAPQLPRDDDYYDDRGSSQFPTAPRLNSVSEDALARAISPDSRYGDEHPDDRQMPSLMAGHHADSYRDDDCHDETSDRPYDEEDYEEVPSSRRRSGLVMIAAVLGLAVLGTAGAFAYRAMFGGSIMPSLPPIIKASDGPNKIVPPNPGTQTGGPSQAGAGPGSEKLVSREEQPVDLQDQTKAPRVISTIPVTPPGLAPGVPAPVMASPGGADPAFGAPPAMGAAAPAPSGPKKVHTVTIRPDQMGGPPAVAAAPPPAAATPAPAASRAPAPLATRSPAPSSGGAEPLALVPAAGAAPATVHPRTAAVVEPASVAPASSGGGYVVQVTSQRSEAEAKAAYRTMKSKYPDQLGNREAMIRRADLGSKGTYYRAMVGPFVSMEEAAGLCSGLKAAGGNCIVQKN